MSRTTIDPGEVHSTITELARPRLTGSRGAEVVGRRVRDRFEAMGYRTRELRCSFSTLPGRYGPPLAGLALAAAGLGGAWLLHAGRPAGALAVLAAGMLAALLPFLLLGRALDLPAGRVETENLLFTRGDPQWIVMAHRDSKSQHVPTLVRTAGVVVALVAWTALMALAVRATGGGVPAAWVGWVGWAGGGALAVAGGVLALCSVGNVSPGALDNATGVAAALAVAERVGPTVGFLITDGEEFGLAGARAAVDRLPMVAGIINLDGLDDTGSVRIAEARSVRRKTGTGAIASALLRDARAMGLEAVRRGLPPFVLVDHQPLAAAGRPALTLLKGTWRSLLRVHSAADTADRLDGSGAASVAALVVRTLGGLSERAGDTLRSGDGSRHSPAP